jgi:hypothetical protein
MEVKGLLGISDAEAEAEAQVVFGPELVKVLQNAMAEVIEDYTPELIANLRKKIDEVVANYRLTEEYVRQVGAGLYNSAVESISNSVCLSLFFLWKSFSGCKLTLCRPIGSRWNPEGRAERSLACSARFVSS